MRKHLSTNTINIYATLYGLERRYLLGIFRESDKHLLKRINRISKEMNIMR
jgi:hypothetical protein